MERDSKTTTEQWSFILDFLEQNPNLLNNKFDSYNDSQNAKQLWSELTTHLNSMGYGCKTADKWQAAISRWKSKVKGKSAAIYRESQATGGGIRKTPPLTTTEERLMGLMGWRCVKGDENPELGFEKSPRTTALSVPSRKASPPPLVSIERGGPITPQLSKQAPASHVQNAENFNPNAATNHVSNKTAPKRRRIVTTTERSRRFVSLNSMHTDVMDVLQRIENRLDTLCQTHERMANCMEKYVQHCIDISDNED